MKTYIYLFYFILFLSSNILGQTDDHLTTGIGSGSGINMNIAIKQALRNAVEDAVGVFIMSETTTKNYQLEKDKILSYSNGLVRNYEILNLEKKQSFFKIKLKVYISNEMLTYTFKKEKYKYDIDAKNLYARANMKFKQINNARKMIDNFKKNYYHLSWNVILDEEGSYDNYENKTVTLNYSLKAKVDYNFFDNILRFLDLLGYTTKNKRNRYLYANLDKVDKSPEKSDGGLWNGRRINVITYCEFESYKMTSTEEIEKRIDDSNFVGNKLYNTLAINTNNKIRCNSMYFRKSNTFRVYLTYGDYSEFKIIDLLPEIKSYALEKLSRGKVKFDLIFRDNNGKVLKTLYLGSARLVFRMQEYVRNIFPVFNKNSIKATFNLSELKLINNAVIKVTPLNN